MLENLHFDRDGLIPIVVQDHETGDVLLLAYMNKEALQKTLDTRLAHFWSRSRGTLWQKGETSGHIQEVVSLHLNCEGNSLLLRVRQHGSAACHDGYRSCYYRQLNDAGTWEITQPRLFDPAEVYPHPASDNITGSAREPQIQRPANTHASATSQRVPQRPSTHASQTKSQQGASHAEELPALADAFRRIYRAYCYLRDHDLETVSGTSQRLRHPDLAWLRQRAVQELGELAGVLAGTHIHTNPQDDTILEGRQACYWLLLLSAASNLPYDSISAHEHLRTGFEAGEKLDTAALDRFAHAISHDEQPLLENLCYGLRLVGGACRQQGIALLALAHAELADLRQKNYLPEQSINNEEA